eukprot:2669475-Amphidinium_carterae.1
MMNAPVMISPSTNLSVAGSSMVTQDVMNYLMDATTLSQDSGGLIICARSHAIHGIVDQEACVAGRRVIICGGK